MLRESKGNMYRFVTHTWNTVKGRCPHNCSYCYMKAFPIGDLRLDERELDTDLGQQNVIFVGSSCDMFADAVPAEWIHRTLDACRKHRNNRYLFQTKNPGRYMSPGRYLDIIHDLPADSIVGTTIESDLHHPEIMGAAPHPAVRAAYMAIISDTNPGQQTFITIEPILRFELAPFVDMIRRARPTFVNIGADSKGHNLPEPTEDETINLIFSLKQFTRVNVKRNLERIIGTREL